MPSYHIKAVNKQTLEAILARYPSAAPEKIRALDALRYDDIPTAVAKREGSKLLEKEEVERLVEWKLRHGTFRPKLLQLVQSNPEEIIKETTASAFALLPTSPSTNDVLAALKILVELKGIGPATASLLLSVANPDHVPFFSDELFRWCMWDDTGSPAGWKIGIKYNAKEYEALLGKFWELKKRLGVRAVDVERVVWVLGKEGVDVGANAEESDEEDDDGVAQDAVIEKEKEEVELVEKPKKETRKGVKRKATEAKPPTEATRKSARTKK